MDKIEKLQSEFEECQKILITMGDEVRQNLLLLMIAGNRNGVRVSDIAEKTSLTRSAVSHHMQIMKNAGIVKSRKEGKYVYYFLDSSGKNIDALLKLLESIRDMIRDDGKNTQS